MLAANDDIANAVIGVLKGNGLAGHVVVTGQDSGIEGLQNIINGLQSMTVFKNVKLEANAAAQLAIALIAGKDPSAPDSPCPTSQTRSPRATRSRLCCFRLRSSPRPTSVTSSRPAR